MSTISERVARGVTWLDENEPDWVARIDLGRLILSSPCRCVLGQVYGDYVEAPHGEFDAMALGFNAYWFPGELNAVDSEFNALDNEWRRVITERRAAA